MRLQLGTAVHCSDGDTRELADVVIDPQQRAITHLIVHPRDRRDLARLVAIEKAHGGDADGSIRIDCTAAEVDASEPVHTAQYLRIGEQVNEDPGWDVGIEEIASMPYYGGFAPGGIDAGTGPTDYDPHVTASYDRVPKGEVEIRHGSEVTSSEGEHVGHVNGFITDDSNRITGFVLAHGHLWGKREIVIEIGSVARIENDEIVLAVPKDEVGR
jgi:sporulation protein YlmC with PRC-barrel domain